MKSRIFLFMLVIIMLTSISTPTFAQDDEHMMDCASVLVVDGWARATVEGAPTGAAYGFVVNLTHESDTLTGGSTSAADAVEIHTMIMDDGVMRMRPVDGGLEIAPMGYAELAPGGLHIMLIGLSAPLEAGSTLDITLTFEKAGDIALTLPVREFDPTAMGMGNMDMGDEEMSDDMGGDMDMNTDDMTMPTIDVGCAAVHFVGAWARPAPEGTPTSAVYGLFVNLSDEERSVVSAETDAAEVVEIHETSVDENDVMRMRPLEDGLALPVGKGVKLMPAGLHMMLINPTRELVAGESLDLTLTYDDGSTMTLPVVIRDPSIDMGGMDNMHGMDMDHGDSD